MVNLIWKFFKNNFKMFIFKEFGSSSTKMSSQNVLDSSEDETQTDSTLNSKVC